MALTTLDLFAPVVADGATQLGTLDRLRIDAGGAGGLVPACLLAKRAPQRVEDLLPRTVLLPGDEIIPDGALGGEIVGEIIPLTAGTGLIHQGVDHLTQRDLARPASRLG